MGMHFSRPPKYRAQRTVYNGLPYASKAEAARARELDMLMKCGQISGWIRQPTFHLGVPENVYRADFLVFGFDGIAWAEDVKGFETKAFKHNKRLWRHYGPCELRIIKTNFPTESIPRGDHAL